MPAYSHDFDILIKLRKDSSSKAAFAMNSATIPIRYIPMILLGLIIAVGVMSCVPKSKEDAGWPGQDGDKIRIVYWDMPHWRGLFGNVLDQNQPYDAWAKRKIREFEAVHPDVKIDYLLIPWKDEDLKLDLALTAGMPPDIAYRNAGVLKRLVSRGVLEPIDEFLSADDIADIPQNIWQMVVVNGQKYAWPWYMGTNAIAVNLDLFRQAGAMSLLPQNPTGEWTVQAFLAAAKKVTRDLDGDGKTDVYAFPLFGVDSHYLYDPWLAGNGVIDKFNADETQSAMGSPRVIEVLQFLADLIYKYKVAPPGAAGLQYSDAYTLFLQQKVAMFPGGIWLVAGIQAQAPEAFDYGFVQFPHWPGQVSRVPATLATYVVFKQSDNKKRRRVMEFAHFLTNTRNDIAVVGNSTFPVRISCGNPYYGDRRFEVFRHYLHFTLPETGFPHSQEIDQLAMPLFQSVFSGERPVQEALQEYVEKVNGILQAETRARHGQRNTASQ